MLTYHVMLSHYVNVHDTTMVLCPWITRPLKYHCKDLRHACDITMQ